MCNNIENALSYLSRARKDVEYVHGKTEPVHTKGMLYGALGAIDMAVQELRNSPKAESENSIDNTGSPKLLFDKLDLLSEKLWNPLDQNDADTLKSEINAVVAQLRASA